MRFPDHPTVPAQARGFVSTMLLRWELAELVPDVQLAVTELVTNAILHARTPIVVTLSVESGLAEVAVTDYDLHAPRVRPARVDLLADLDAIAKTATDDGDPRHAGLHYGASGSVAAGRGLIILDAITASWGVTPHPDGKDVWARLSVPESWTFRPDCICRAQANQSTASGRPLAHIPGGWDKLEIDRSGGQPA